MNTYKILKRIILGAFALLYFHICRAQTEMPFRGADTDLLIDTLKTDKNGTYYLWREQDSLWMVFLSFASPYNYRLLDMKEHVLVEGTLGERLENGHLLVKEGRWTEYYKEGGIKSTGYYEANQPLGYWEYYYPNGIKKRAYQYSKIAWNDQDYLLMLGAYEEFYNNGQIKLIGKYTSGIDTIAINGTEDANGVPEFKYVPVAKRTGTWYYYQANGALFKEEKY